MAHTVKILLLIGLLATVAPAVADEVTATFTVEKMTCATCPLTVRKVMERVDGVVEAKVDYDTKTAIVTYDDERTTAAEIAAAATEIGYPAMLHTG
ncbi:MAG: cation transporter [Woeseia sp.]